ncbi:MAG: helix-turn-helix domain containing protein [Alphaproteobacteria bacterium]|nr:helix-turn-helix domain containing protein [Alphaproteobacteria bacterium]
MNKSEKTKSKIFKEAKKLFWNYGYSNVSVRQIAKAVKVDVALIPRYYSSKLGLFKATLDRFNWVDDIDINDDNIIDVYTGWLLESMDMKDETTVVKMLIMNSSDPVVGNFIKNINIKKMRNPILKKLKKVSPLQYDLMISAFIGISQTRKTLKMPTLTSLKKTQYEKILKHIFKGATTFKS